MKLFKKNKYLFEMIFLSNNRKYSTNTWKND